MPITRGRWTNLIWIILQKEIWLYQGEAVMVLMDTAYHLCCADNPGCPMAVVYTTYCSSLGDELSPALVRK